MLSVILMSFDMKQEEKSKFETLYYKYRNILFSNAIAIVKNEIDAEDVLQNAFMKIAQNIKSVGDTESKETASFLIVITKNCAYDFLRKNLTDKEFFIEELEDIPSPDNSLELLVSNLEYGKIISVIKNISSPYNEVLYLHYVKDYSYKKTAALLGRKVHTVKMQLVRGKKILVEKLSEVLYD